MSDRRLLAAFAVVIFGLGLFMFARGRLSGPGTPDAATLSDAAMTAAMVENVGRLPDSMAAVHHNPDGSPDIAVSGGVLIVATMNPDTAASLCRSVAAITNDSATGKPLGILGVTVISGGQKVADCRP